MSLNKRLATPYTPHVYPCIRTTPIMNGTPWRSSTRRSRLASKESGVVGHQGEREDGRGTGQKRVWWNGARAHNYPQLPTRLPHTTRARDDQLVWSRPVWANRTHPHTLHNKCNNNSNVLKVLRVLIRISFRGGQLTRSVHPQRRRPFLSLPPRGFFSVASAWNRAQSCLCPAFQCNTWHGFFCPGGALSQYPTC